MGLAVGATFDLSVDVFQLSVVKSVSVSVGVSMCVSVVVAMVSSVDVSVGDRGLPWYTVNAFVDIDGKIFVDLVVEVAVESSLACALSLLGVTLLAAEFREREWNVRESPWKAHGCPWSVLGYP